METFRSTPYAFSMYLSAYGYAWKIFSWFGIDINKAQRKLDCKNFTRMLLKFPFMLWIISTVYNMGLAITVLQISIMDLRAVIPSFVSCFLSNILWVLMYKRRTAIAATLENAAKFSNKHQFEIFFRSGTFNLILAAYFAMQVTYVLVAVYLLKAFEGQYPYYSKYWTLGYDITYGIWWNIVMFFCNMAYVLQTATFPGFVSLLMSGMFLQLSRTFRSYKRKLKTFTDSDESLVEFVREYSKLIGIVREFNDVLSTPILVVLAMHILLMFNGLAVFFLVKEDLMEPLVGENVFLLICCSCFILSISAFASNVHIEAQATSVVLKDLYERELNNSKLFSRQLDIIQEIANKDEVTISAGGMIHFKRQFILSVLGGFLTYTLLFISIKRQ